MIQASETIFKHLYRARLDYDYYHNPDFVPVYTAVGPGPNGTAINMAAGPTTVCGNDVTCQYDFSVTGNENVAMATKSATESVLALKQMSVKGITY
jgi:hypothetical protein